ncbi:MAG: reverse transcriptase family protein, partial [Pseudomonadota bacterium]
MLTKHALARNLATSLTQSDWSERTLAATLRRRLPVGFEKTTGQIAKALITETRSLYAPPPKTVAAALARIDAFDRLYRTCRRRNIWPAPDLASAEMAPIARFQHLDLPALPTLAALAEWLLLDPDTLTALADPQNRRERHGDMAVNHYHRRLIPKRSGEMRLLEAPKQRLKAVQRQILHGLLARLPDHPDAYGFIPGRNCIQAAARHAGEALVIRFDLQDFFPSLTAARAYGLFRCLGYPHTVAHHLTALCTTATPPHVLDRVTPAMRPILRGPHLPQGAPTSPALAN